MGIPPQTFLSQLGQSQQGAQQQDPLTTALMNGPSSAPDQQQPPPANNAQNAGPVKAGLRSVLAGMLGNFSYGAGQAMVKASGGETDAERATRLAQTAHLNAQTQLVQQQANMMTTTVPVTMPNGAIVHLPPSMAKDILKQQVANQGGVEKTLAAKRYVVTPQGLYDTQTQDANGMPSLVPGSGAGITITPEMTQQYPIPQEFVGKQIKLTDLAALQRGQAFSNQMIQTAAGPVVVPKAGPNMGKATPVTINGQRIPSNQEAGAYWQAKYGVVQTVDADGNPMYTSRLNAPGAAPATGALQIFKGKAGLDNYKDALNRVSNNLGQLDDPGQRALIAQTMRNIGTNHDPGVITSFITNALGNGLTPQSADLVAAMQQAREFIGANRQFAGNFNGSEALYNRMVANAPGVANARQINEALIKQDLKNTDAIEQRMTRFQGGAKKTPAATPKGDPLKLF